MTPTERRRSIEADPRLAGHELRHDRHWLGELEDEIAYA